MNNIKQFKKFYIRSYRVYNTNLVYTQSSYLLIYLFCCYYYLYTVNLYDDNDYGFYYLI